MNYLRYIYLFVLIVLSSCTVRVIGEKDMTMIIAELYKADRYINVNYQMLRKADTTRVYEAVLNEYGYKTEEFIHSLDYYLERPGKLKSIYIRAKAIIEEEDKFIENIIEQEKRLKVFREPIKRIEADWRLIKKYNSRERALRWLLLPDKYPQWSIVMKDFTGNLYENPQMSEWWKNNFKNDKFINYIVIEDEKDSGAIHISTKRSDSDKKRPLKDR